ncbi:MAG: GtrA family protein [Thermomicrobiales bacterium]
MERIERQQWVLQAWSIAQRFQKYLVVGAIGLGVNQGLLMLLVSLFGLPVALASPPAIAVSVIVTFVLNETWTWHDRGSGKVLHRALIYLAINSGGLLINWGLLVWLEGRGMPYQIANLFGAAVAAVWNFTLNNAITWRESP